jgi:GNAT superfamily N-acetyltransferase
MMPRIDPRELAGLLPDEPRWIDLRGLLLTGRCDVHAEREPERGFVAVSRDFPFAGLWGSPGPERIGAAAARGRAACAGRETADGWQLLAAPEARPIVASALPGWRRRGILLHRLARPLRRPAAKVDAEVRLLADGHGEVGLELDHLPAATRQELTLEWVAGRPMAVAMAGGRPLSFCYAAFTTERLWDVAIETLEPFRRRGLAAACFLELAAHMERGGRAPTWGAMEDNPASLGLAARLGFVPDAALDGWAAAGRADAGRSAGPG